MWRSPVLWQTCWRGEGKAQRSDMSCYQHKSSPRRALSHKTPHGHWHFTLRQNTEGKERESPLQQPVVYWHYCQRCNCSSYPNQLQASQLRYDSCSAYLRPQAWPATCVWHRHSSATAPALLADTALRRVVMSSNTTRCSDTLANNILEGIWASAKSCKLPNVADNAGNPQHLPGKEWQQVSLGGAAPHALPRWLVKQVIFKDALFCPTLGV